MGRRKGVLPVNRELLKKLGNIDQIAGIRESVLLRGRGEGMKIAEFHNAAGLCFSVAEDRCMDLYDLSFRGVNFSFHSRNGLTGKAPAGAEDAEFAEHWPGGMLVTCGLDNINGASGKDGVNYPTHGRIGAVPAQHFSAKMTEKNGETVLLAEGEMRQSRMYGGTFLLHRTIETGLYKTTVRITDEITNVSDREKPYFLLYHFNFGYPLLDEGAEVFATGVRKPLDEKSREERFITAPGSGVQKFLWTDLPEEGMAAVYNKKLGLAAVLRFDTGNLPCMTEWKHLNSCDYVLALEPMSTRPGKREELIAGKDVLMIPAYGTLVNSLELEIQEGSEGLCRRFPEALFSKN